VASFVEVSEAVVERIAPVLPDPWTVRWFKPTPPPIPGLYLTPDPNKYADYQITNSSFTQWSIRAELYAAAFDREAAHRIVGKLTDPNGPLISRLLDDDLRDTLWDLCGLNIAVTTGTNFKLRAGRSPYLTATIGLVLGAN
jgi:hypothetical protein